MVENFSYMVKSAKQGMGHGTESENNGLIEAWARLGRDSTFPSEDYEATKTNLAGELMATFRYVQGAATKRNRACMIKFYTIELVRSGSTPLVFPHTQYCAILLLSKQQSAAS